jgi:hypothetical protein
MGNETCPPGPVGVNGTQTDLNAPVTAPTGPVGPGSPGYTQYHNLNDLHTLCQYGMSPSLTSAVLMTIVSNHFANPNLIMTENLQQYVYRTDSTTKIRIVQNTHFDPTQAGLYPAIVFTRGEQVPSRITIGDDLGAIDKRAQQLGISSYVRMITGSHTIMCTTEADGEAEDLALEVFDCLNFLSPALRLRNPFHDFQVTKLGVLGVLEDQGNIIAVPITVTYVYEYAWALQPLAPALKTFNLSVS